MSHEKHHDKVVPGLLNEKDLCKVREAVCIQVEKIYDSCREKDCIENARVIFKHNIQNIVDEAINVKVRCAEVVDVYADIEEVPFKRGFFTVDVKFFIRVTLDFFVPDNGGIDIVTRRGLVVFDKKVILFGSEGNVKIFKSHFKGDCRIDKKEINLGSKLQQDNLPIAKVEVAEPIALNAKIQDILDKCFEDCCCIDQIPRGIADTLGVEDDDCNGDIGPANQIPRRRVVVSLGLFSIIKLVRLVQLLIPAFDFCFPNKECIAATDENPCELFETIEFPFNEFSPPQKFDFPGAVETEQHMMEEFGLND